MQTIKDKLKATGLVGALFLLTISFASAADSADSANSWMTDFEAAQSKAAETGKPMLLNFSGSDWCHWCIQLDKEVLSQDAFQEYAASELVLVEVDFPRGKQQSEAVKTQNKALAEKYGIRGFPTVILLSSEGELIGQTGYRPGGAEAYVAHLKEGFIQ